jgi:hypothetical protein
LPVSGHRNEVTDEDERVEEMTGYGKRGKTTTGFPLFPQLLEIAARFPHSLNSDDGPVEKWKSNTFPPPSLLSPLEDSQKGDSSVPELSPPFGLIVGLEYAALLEMARSTSSAASCID